jgi:hypothetical protein
LFPETDSNVLLEGTVEGARHSKFDVKESRVYREVLGTWWTAAVLSKKHRSVCQSND